MDYAATPADASVTNTYHATGERQRTSGSRTYPVEHTHDHAGRMKTLKTWQNFTTDTGVALTTWKRNNPRTRVTHADGSYWLYKYDTLGQVTSGKHCWADGTPVAGQQFEYGFDDIGNRQSAAHGGNASGSDLRVETYTANALNQYTQRTVPGLG